MTSTSWQMAPDSNRIWKLSLISGLLVNSIPLRSVWEQMIINNITRRSFHPRPDFILEDLNFLLPGCLPGAIKSSPCRQLKGADMGTYICGHRAFVFQVTKFEAMFYLRRDVLSTMTYKEHRASLQPTPQRRQRRMQRRLSALNKQKEIGLKQ